MSRRQHWDQVYADKSPEEVSWHQVRPEPSLEAMRRFGLGKDASVIDVGGGASTFVDHLVRGGFADVTVLDLAETALDASRARLGRAGAAVQWEVGDITVWTPSRTYDLWHDRAVFHFLTDLDQRRSYRNVLDRSLRSGGLAVIATFAPDGPEKCSGLPVRRYDASDLAAELQPGFELLESWREVHVTPWGAEQPFTWCVFRKR